jgi:heat shock protein 90kDa beta
MGSQNAEMLKYMGGRRVLEINPRHPLVQHIKALVEADEDSEDARSMARVMYQTALLESGLDLPSTKGFATRVYDLMQQALRLEHGHAAEPVHHGVSDDEEEDVSEERLPGIDGAEEDFGDFGDFGAEAEEHDEL